MYYVIILISILGPLLHLFLSKAPRTLHRIAEIFLVYMLFSMVGIAGIYGFLGHTLYSQSVAKFIGWQPHRHFQFEVACANLAFGVLGILSLKFRGNFWAATIIGYTVFLWGAAFGHIKDMLEQHNYAQGNAGLILYIDIIIPAFLLLFLMVYKTSKSR